MWYKIHSLHTQPARGVAKIYWRRCQCFEKNLFLGHQHLGFVFEGSQAFSFGIFVVGFSSIFHYKSSQSNPSVDDAKPSASDPKKKSFFPYFDRFWWHLQRAEVWWFYGYKGRMMGFWSWFSGSFVWLEWITVHGKSYFYTSEKLFF